MEKKQIDWENLGFGYVQTEQRYVSNYKDGKWDDGCLTEDANITINECAGARYFSEISRLDVPLRSFIRCIRKRE